MPSNSTIIYDEFGNTPDWIEIYNPEYIDLTGYGLSDDIENPFKFIFPSNNSLAAESYVLIFASGEGQESIVQHWETVIDWGDEWNYFYGTSNPPSDWLYSVFDDSGWLSGPSGFGYGDGDDATIVPQYMSVFIRKSFNIESIHNIAKIILHVDYDDAFVAYLNGIEIARSNIGIPGIIPNFNEGANEWHEAVLFTGGNPEEYEIEFNPDMLTNEENILAIQVHNFSQTSSDMSLIPFLTLGMLEEPSNPSGTSETLDFPPTNLHANFKIDSDGETLILSNTLGDIIDMVDSISVPTDISFGRQPDGGSEWLFFSESTPNSPNNTEGSYESCEIPEFSYQEGFYSSAIEVYLSIGSGVQQIYYSLDGSIPTEESFVYSVPIYVDQTTVIRAGVVNSICPPGAVVTKSYFIDEISNLPTVSLSTDPDNLFDEEYGIYVLGNNYENWNPFFGANFWEDWERPIHIEFFEPDGTLGFAQDAGVKIFGGWSRAMAQKSLSIFARSEYGNNEINYQIFPDKNIDSFKSIVLRNSGNDWYSGENWSSNSMFRDGMQTGLMDNTGIDHQAYRPAVVYLNGEYWGIHNIREKVNEEFLASNNSGVDPEEIDELDAGGESIEGDNQDYIDMISFIENNPLDDPYNYSIVEQQMDISNFIDYYLAQIFYANTDWPGNNLKFWRPHTIDGKWKWILYDTDFGFGLVEWYGHNTLQFALEANGPGWPNPPWSTFLFRSLMENQDFQTQFINHYCYYLNTRFKPDNVHSHIANIVNTISPEMPRHIQKWGGNMTQWYQNANSIIQFGDYRQEYVFNHLASYFGLNQSSNLEISSNPEEGGSLYTSNQKIPENLWQATYFNDIPIKVSATPNPGFIFSHWAAGEAGYFYSSDEDIVVTLDGDLSLTAVFMEVDSPGNIISINEILASNDTINMDEAGESDDWIELYNSGLEVSNIGGLFLTDNSENLSKWMIPVGTMVEPEDFIIFWCDEDQEQGELHTNFKLSGQGESLFLVDFDGYSILDSISFGLQSTDISYGRHSEGDANWRFFESPTPGASNFNLENLGDVNGDESINVLDVVILVGIVLDGEYSVYGDINTDDSVDILDIVQLVNIILGNPRLIDATLVELIQKNQSFHLSGNGYIGAIQMTISHDLDFSIELTDSAMVAEYRTNGYSTKLIIVAPMSEEIFSTPDDYSVETVLIANSSEWIDVNIPSKYSLSHAYPNPFNNTTNIDFNIPSEANVMVKIYNILGKEVTTLINSRMDMGYHHLIWDASYVSSGIYFIQMSSDSFSQTEKIILLK